MKFAFPAAAHLGPVVVMAEVVSEHFVLYESLDRADLTLAHSLTGFAAAFVPKRMGELAASIIAQRLERVGGWDFTDALKMAHEHGEECVRAIEGVIAELGCEEIDYPGKPRKETP